MTPCPHPSPPRAPTRRRAGRVAASLAGFLVACGGCRSVHPPATKPKADPSTRPAAYTAPSTVAKPEAHQTRAEVAHQADQRASIHFDLARARESAGLDEAAVAEYQQAIAAAPGGKAGKALRARAERRTGAALDRLGRFAQAETHYREALKLGPDDPKTWNDQGYSYYLQGRWADAGRSLAKAVALAPDDPRIRTNLGLAQAASGDLDKAYDTLTLAGGPAAAHANLGYVLAASGRRDEAKVHYASALQLSPGFGPARLALAQLDAPASAAATQLAARPDPDLGHASTAPR